MEPPNLLGLNISHSLKSGTCQSRPNDAIPNLGGHLAAHLRCMNPRCHPWQSGHLASQQGFPPGGHTLLARVQVMGTSSGSDRTPARGHLVQGTLVTGANEI